MINRKARSIMHKYGMSKILDAFGHQPPTTLVLNNYPDFLTKFDVEGGFSSLHAPSCQLHSCKSCPLTGVDPETVPSAAALLSAA